MSKRHVYTNEFKERAVRLSLDPSMTVGEVASQLEIAPSSIVKWRQKMGVSVGRAGEGARTLREENDKLRAELKQAEKDKRALAMEVEILKKAAAFFAKNLA